MKCNHCGSKNDDQARFCSRCGQQLPYTEPLHLNQTTIRMDSPRVKNPPNMLIPLVLLVGALLGVLLFRDAPSKKEPPVPENKPVVQQPTETQEATPEETAPAVNVEEPLHIVAVDGGRDHTAVLYSDGTVRCVGSNKYGQCDTESWTDIIQISTLKNHTVGLRADGTVVATGQSDSGQCDVHSWKDIIAVSAGQHHTVGLCSDGTVVSVGLDSSGEVDLSHWRNIVAIGCAYSNTAGLCADGTVLVSGSYTKGPLPNCSNISAISVSDAHFLCLRSDGTAKAITNTNRYEQLDVGDWRDVISVSAGCSFSVGLRSNGTVYVQGINDCNQHDARYWTDIILIGTGLEHVIGVRSDGTLIAAGKDDGDGKLDVWKLNP